MTALIAEQAARKQRFLQPVSTSTDRMKLLRSKESTERKNEIKKKDVSRKQKSRSTKSSDDINKENRVRRELRQESNEAHLLSVEKMGKMDESFDFTIPSIAVQEACMRRAIASLNLTSITDKICCVCDLYVPIYDIKAVAVTSELSTVSVCM